MLTIKCVKYYTSAVVCDSKQFQLRSLLWVCQCLLSALWICWRDILSGKWHILLAFLCLLLVSVFIDINVLFRFSTWCKMWLQNLNKKHEVCYVHCCFLRSVGCGDHFESEWLPPSFICRFTASYYYLKVLLIFVLLFKRCFAVGSWDVLLKGRHTDTGLQQRRLNVSLLGRCTTNEDLNYICACPLVLSFQEKCCFAMTSHA